MNILLYVVRGIPFGFLMLILNELFSAERDMDRLLIYFLVILATMVVGLWLSISTQVNLSETAIYLAADLRLRLGMHLKKLSLGFFKNHNPGDVTAPLLQDMKNFESIFNRFYSNMIASIVLPVMTVIFLFVIDWQLASLLLLFIVLSVPSLLLSRRVIEKLGEQVVATRTKASSELIEYYMGMKVFKAYRGRGKRFKRLDDTFQTLRKVSIRLEAFVVPLVFSYMVVLEIGFVISVLVGTRFIFSNEITIPAFLLFLIIGNRLFDLLQGFGVFAVMMRYMTVAADRISNVLCTKPLAEPIKSQLPANFSIEFDAVSFSYDKRPVLHDISFVAPEGSLTALVGASGTGKSTIANLVSRFWDVDNGAVKIGGVDIRDIESEQLLTHISSIFQDVYLFNDTIYNNIRIGNSNASEEDVVAAARAANCHNFIEKLPQGYHSTVGEGGEKLSAGEKQRISIARAILKNSKIVLLDEATASLDPENEKEIQEAMNILVQNKTLIVIAHRLSTICHADQILVLRQGQIAERGSHADLLKKGGIYRQMWQKQRAAMNWELNSQSGDEDRN